MIDAATDAQPDLESYGSKTNNRRRSSLAQLQILMSKPSILASKSFQRKIPSMFGRWLKPSCFCSHFLDQRPTKELRKTAALDGLRGVAAMSVVLFHFILNWFPVNYGFISGDPNTTYVWNLPVLKFFMNGPAGVHIFLVISGYILSLRSLQQMRKRDMDGLVKTLSSSTFRRTFRLLAPITVSLLLEMCALQMGLMERARLTRMGPMVPLRAASIMEKFAQLLDNLKGLGNLFSWADYHNNNFDDDLWTIGFEYRCSMLLFLLLLAICRISTPWKRRVLVASLTIICRVYDRWDFILFIFGLLLADFDAFSANNSEPKISGRHQPFWAFVTIAGMHLCSLPMMGGAERALGFGWIAPLGDIVFPAWGYRLSWSIGAACMVAAAMHSVHLRYVLESKPIQYLGRISYMQYVIHGPLLRSLGFMIVQGLWDMWTTDVTTSPVAYAAGVFLGFILFMLVLFWTADLFTRLVDDKCVAMARWIEDQFIKE